MPKPAWNEEYLVNLGIRSNAKSAKNLVRPFKRMGFFTEEGKATDRAYDWLEDAKYSEVCNQLLNEIYPETVTHAFTTTDENTRELLEKWFQRNVRVLPAVASSYAAFYMLLLEADPSKQEEVANKRPIRKLKADQAASSGSETRSSGAKTGGGTSSAQQSRNTDAENAQNRHESEHRGEPKRGARSIEPLLNINVQLHIPPEATVEQIDQICKSLAKYLYRQQDEVGE